MEKTIREHQTGESPQAGPDSRPDALPAKPQAAAGAGDGAAAPPMERRKRRRWPWVAALIVVALGVTFLKIRTLSAQTAKSQQAGRDAALRAVPVTGAVARSVDLPVYLSGVGSVMPVKTVTVRSRVDGELISVAYGEGQSVREGDLLAQIDPRPFEVQLHQAEGQLAKDEAALANAKIDLEALQGADRAGLDLPPAARHPGRDRRPGRGGAQERPGAGRERQAEPDLQPRSRRRSPGVVGLRLVDPGNIVHASDPNGLVVITQQQPIAVVFTIAADHLPPCCSR